MRGLSRPSRLVWHGLAHPGGMRGPGPRMTSQRQRAKEMDKAKTPAKNSGRLAENILYFARALRAAGIPVGPGAVIDALAAVEAARVGTREDFYWTLHAVFVQRHEHSILFDQAFRIFFRRRGLLERLLAITMPQVAAPRDETEKPALQRIQEALFASAGERAAPKAEIEVDARFTVSDREVLQRKDFAQ